MSGTVCTVAVPRGRIDRRSPVPYFFQLKSLIAAGLDAGLWAPEEQLPSEPELCRRYEVSRATVRQALAELEREGRVRKEKGRGTFAAHPRPSSWLLQSAHGFYDEEALAGRAVTSRVLRRDVVPLPAWAATALDADEGGDSMLLERLRSVDGEIVMYVESYLVGDFADAILTADLERGSLYHVLRSAAGVEVAGGRRVVEATSAHAQLARLLEVEPGAAVLHVEALSVDAGGRPFEAYRAWHRSDRTKIAVQVVGGAPPPSPNGAGP